MKTAQETKPLNPAMQRIAHEILGMETLEVRNSDRLDFHDLGVSTIRRALEAAFEAGRQEGNELGISLTSAEQKLLAAALDKMRAEALRLENGNYGAYTRILDKVLAG